MSAITISGVIIYSENLALSSFYAEQDYWRYSHDLKEAATHNQAAIHAHVLMTNHVS
jgi:hypothetical protein